MNNVKWGFGVGFIIFISTMLFLNIKFENGDIEKEIIEEEKTDKVIEFSNPFKNNKLIDNNDIYKLDIDSNVDEIYVTIVPSSLSNSVTFNELNKIKKDEVSYISDSNDEFVEIHFNTKDNLYKDNDLNSPNATIEIRGQSSRNSPQKSYKIKLFDKTNKWNGFSIINLNKHYPDSLKIRNKLSFDYFEIIPDFISLRTRFVKLYIKDVNDNDYKNYGLYTFIEQPNKRFLKRHKLDFNGHLYKAEFFEFYRYKENIKSKEDITFDKSKFEQVLEVNGNDNHKKLIKMLDDLNDYSKNINDVVKEHFDKDNLLTWLGVNILFDNYDTNSRNFLLYSHLNYDKWYFIPWDYDGAWSIKDRGKWQKGLSNYWGMVLFNRYFKYPSNVKDLSEKIEELSEIINKENTKIFLDRYYNVVKENLFIPPDNFYIKTSLKEYHNDYYYLVNLTDENKKYYYESLENPMPFYLGEPIKEDNKYKFIWEESFDIQGDDITYSFLLSTDSDFENLVIKKDKLINRTILVDNLIKGEYYWKVIAYDSNGNYQIAFDYFKEDNDETKYGIKKIIIR